MKPTANVNQRLLSGAVGGLTLTVVGVLVSLLQFSILLRRLSLETAGIWMLFTNLGGYVLLLDLGLSPTLGREISFASANPTLSEVARNRRIGVLIRSCTTAVSALAFLIALCGAFGGWVYLRTIVPGQLAATARPAWFVYMGAAALNLVGEGWFAGIYGLGHVFQEKIVRSAGSLLGLILMTIAVFSGFGFMGLALAYLAQCCCTVLLAKVVLSRYASNSAKAAAFDWQTIRALVYPSLKYAITLLGGILILQTDNLVIASILGPAAIPNYQAVAKIVTILMSLSMMLATTSLPIASQAYSRSDMASMTELLYRNLRFCLSVMVILGSFIACFTDRFILTWLGKGHFVGFAVVWILLIVMLLEAHHQVMAASVMATGKIVFVAPALIAGALNLVFSVLLARRFGLVGVVLGTMCAQVLTNNWYAPFVTMRVFSLSVRQHLRTVVGPVLQLLAVMLSFGALVRFMTRGLPALASVSIGAVTMVAVGAGSFTMFMINAQERSGLSRKVKAISMRWTNTAASDLTLP